MSGEELSFRINLSLSFGMFYSMGNNVTQILLEADSSPVEDLPFLLEFSLKICRKRSLLV